MDRIIYTKDPETGAEYIRFSDKQIGYTTVLREGLFADISDDGSVVGIEILNTNEK
jgi:uncharacterized protein YuzE